MYFNLHVLFFIRPKLQSKFEPWFQFRLCRILRKVVEFLKVSWLQSTTLPFPVLLWHQPVLSQFLQLTCELISQFYAVLIIIQCFIEAVDFFRQAYKEGKVEKPFIPSEETEEPVKPIIPEDLVCPLCQDLLTEAVMMPCCGISFCDDCKYSRSAECCKIVRGSNWWCRTLAGIRNALIESEDNQCPDCKEAGTSPETLIPNRFLRNSVNSFRNKTGYSGGGQRVKKNDAVSAAISSNIGMIRKNCLELILSLFDFHITYFVRQSFGVVLAWKEKF